MEETGMAIDFTIPDDAKEVRARVRKWVHEECIPAEKRLTDGEAFPDAVSYTHLTLPTTPYV